MRYVYQLARKHIYVKLIKPLLESVSPIHETALGAAIGMFVGLTPTVGVQMWVVLMIWLGCKYLLKLKFDLVVGTALVWVSNPFTMFFMYYGFLVTGHSFLAMSGISSETLHWNYTTFHDQLSQRLDNYQHGSIQIVIDGTKFLLIDLGYPMLVGSLFFAVPLSVLSYISSRRFLTVFRKQKAKKMGISYEQWQELFERK